jgi:GH35 family endo-1,4-beta-xylanase
MGDISGSVIANMTAATSTPNIPHLKKTGTTTQLIVDGKPFLILGGELQNSSLTSARYMEGVWQKMIDTGVNTLLGCVTWEDIEPEEGTFSFSELEKILAGAAKHEMKLVLLWFGSFKNGTRLLNPSASGRATVLTLLSQEYQHIRHHG